jgi:hypothetical protein
MAAMTSSYWPMQPFHAITVLYCQVKFVLGVAMRSYSAQLQPVSTGQLARARAQPYSARTSPDERRCRGGHLIFRTATPNVHPGLTATPPFPPRVPLQRSVSVLPLHQHPPELARWLPSGGCSHRRPAHPLPVGAPDARCRRRSGALDPAVKGRPASLACSVPVSPTPCRSSIR